MAEAVVGVGYGAEPPPLLLAAHVGERAGATIGGRSLTHGMASRRSRTGKNPPHCHAPVIAEEGTQSAFAGPKGAARTTSTTGSPPRGPPCGGRSRTRHTCRHRASSRARARARRSTPGGRCRSGRRPVPRAHRLQRRHAVGTAATRRTAPPALPEWRFRGSWCRRRRGCRRCRSAPSPVVQRREPRAGHRARQAAGEPGPVGQQPHSRRGKRPPLPPTSTDRRRDHPVGSTWKVPLDSGCAKDFRHLILPGRRHFSCQTTLTGRSSEGPREESRLD